MWSRNSPPPYLEQTPSSDCAGRLFFQCPGCKSAQDRMSWNRPHQLFWGPCMKTIIMLCAFISQSLVYLVLLFQTKDKIWYQVSFVEPSLKWKTKLRWSIETQNKNECSHFHFLSTSINQVNEFSFSLQETVIDKGHICPTSTRTRHPQCRGDEKKRNLGLATIWRTKMFLPESSGRKAMATERRQQREKLRKM